MIDVPLFKVYMSPRANHRVSRVLGSGYVGQGPMVDAFERELGKFLKTLPNDPLTVSSGTHALDLAYHLIGLGPGDKVITTPLTCTATSTPLVNRGVRLIWADLDENGNLDPVSVEEAYTEHPDAKAVVAVDWAGTLCDYLGLRMAVRGEIPIVQDAAHAFGALEKGSPFLATDRRGDYVAFSFQAIKHLTTVDGGALVVPQDQYPRAKLLRWYGLDRESSASFRCAQMVEEAGYKYHMNDVAASIGLANIQNIEGIINAHRSNAEYLNRGFYGLSLRDNGVEAIPYDEGSSYWLYTLLVEDREDFTAFMAKRKISVSPAHNRIDRMPCFRRATVEPEIERPRAEHFTARHICIPVGWWLDGDSRARVRAAVIEYGDQKYRERQEATDEGGEE